nr:hypothetical protein [Leuconostoc mesenteroides]
MSTEFNLSFVQGLTVREKAELVTGKDFWFTAENIENDYTKNHGNRWSFRIAKTSK